MDDLRVGSLFRAARRRLHWRQIDVARRAGVSQQLVALIESGRIEAVTLRTLRTVGAALEVRLPFAPQWRGGAGDALLDARHAAIVNSVIATLRITGWICVPEYSFSHYGERGSVDVLAWNPPSRALVVIEAKSRLFDIQALLLGIDRKARLFPQIVARERGWRASVIGRVVVLEDARANRSAVERNAAAFQAAFPARSRQVRHWLRDPSVALAGLWFLTLTNPTGDKHKTGGPQRVRTSRTRSASASSQALASERPSV